MSEIKRKWDLLSPEKRKTHIAEIITFFQEERGDELGIIAAESFLDFFLQDIGAEIYDRGVTDAKELLRKRCEDLELDLDVLLRK